MITLNNLSKLIFIEGVSGVGKTTTTTLLSDKLQSMGYKVKNHLEGAKNNSLDPFGGAYPPAMSITTFCETYLQRWQNFMESKYENDFMVVDGTLLHHQINDLIREYGASDEVIIVLLCRLMWRSS